jgi:predicted nucleic acid-binding protein
MITALDTNVLLDVLIPDVPHNEESERALVEAVRAGALLISEPVYAELAVHFLNRADLDLFLTGSGIRLEPSGAEALYRAGRAWSEYSRRRPAPLACPRCGAAGAASRWGVSSPGSTWSPTS